jgi:hypothetical protein
VAAAADVDSSAAVKTASTENSSKGKRTKASDQVNQNGAAASSQPTKSQQRPPPKPDNYEEGMYVLTEKIISLVQFVKKWLKVHFLTTGFLVNSIFLSNSHLTLNVAFFLSFYKNFKF